MPAASPPPDADPHAAHTLCDELQRVHASVAASAAAPRSALVLRCAAGAAGGGAPQAVHREVCGLAWALGELRTALPRAAADAALVPEPYTLQASARARPAAPGLPLMTRSSSIAAPASRNRPWLSQTVLCEAWPLACKDSTVACAASPHKHQLSSICLSRRCVLWRTHRPRPLHAPCRWSGGLRTGSPSAASSASSSSEARATRTARTPTAPPWSRRPRQGPPGAPARRGRRPTWAARPRAAGTSPPAERRPCACASARMTPAASRRRSPSRWRPPQQPAPALHGVRQACMPGAPSCARCTQDLCHTPRLLMAAHQCNYRPALLPPGAGGGHAAEGCHAPGRGVRAAAGRACSGAAAACRRAQQAGRVAAAGARQAALRRRAQLRAAAARGAGCGAEQARAEHARKFGRGLSCCCRLLRAWNACTMPGNAMYCVSRC
jgi:hypothetical protein